MVYKVDVVSNEGHTTLEFTSKEELVERVRDLAKDDSKWVYIDSNFVDAKTLNVGHITEDAPIILTNPLVGG